MEGPFKIAQNNGEGISPAVGYAAPRPHRDLYDSIEDDSTSKDPERSINHILHMQDTYVRVETKYNTDDVDDFGPFHKDLENEQTYVKTIEVVVFGQGLDRSFLETVRSYCPVLVYTEARGGGMMLRFIHPKFFR